MLKSLKTLSVGCVGLLPLLLAVGCGGDLDEVVITDEIATDGVGPEAAPTEGVGPDEIATHESGLDEIATDEIGSLKQGISSSRLNVMGFNVRIPADSGEQSWANRLPRIRQVINGFANNTMPHIIGFQELKRDLFINTLGDIHGQLNINYWYYFVDRGDGEMIATFVNTSRLEVLDFGFMGVSKDHRKNVAIFNLNNPGCEDQDRDPQNRPIQYVLVRDRNTNRRNYYFNTHFPSKHSCERHAQSWIFARYVESRADLNARVILNGDFNDGIESDGHVNGSFQRLMDETGMVSAFFSGAPITPPSQASAFMTCTTSTGHCATGTAWNKTRRIGSMIDHFLVHFGSDVVETGIDRSMFRRDNDVRVNCEFVTPAGFCNNSNVLVSAAELYSDHWAVWASLVQ
jgi:endonuclease/exonuclease/phosphatase family metal-dependent hydrolase